MKRFKMIAIMLLMLPGWAMAQDSAMTKEELLLMKEDYINEKVEFTTDEALAFWALFDEMEGKRKEVRRASRLELRQVAKTGIDNMTDEQLDSVMTNRLNAEQQLLDLRKEYHQKFIDLVGIRKTAKYYEAELQWKKELIKQLKGTKKRPGLVDDMDELEDGETD